MKQTRITIGLIARSRLHNQALAQPRFATAADVVRWLGAVQAQDFAAAKWAVGQRMREATDERVGLAFDDGAVLRTHVLRPTWHLVSPEDIRWLIALTAPRVKAANAHAYRRFGLDASTLRRSNTIIEHALRGGGHLTRADLVTKLRAARLASDSIAFGYLLMAAELDALICSGPRRGKQHTYALLEERVPPAPAITRDEALARLTRRFFTSHGPATVHDFSWWSGLLLRDARIGLELLKTELACDTVDGEQYWRMASALPPRSARRAQAHLLPNYDEYLVGYTDRRAAYEVDRAAGSPRTTPLFANTALIDGRVVATWQRSLHRDAVAVLVTPMHPLKPADQAAVHGAAERYAAFVGRPLRLMYAA